MAGSSSSAALLSPPETSSCTAGLRQEAVRPGLTISLLEIGSLSSYFSDSLFSVTPHDHLASGPQRTQTLCSLLKDIKDILKCVASFEETSTEANEALEDSSASEPMPELQGLDKVNKTLLKNLSVSLDPDKEQDTKEQMILRTESPKHVALRSARYVGNSCDRRAFSETQLAVKKRRRKSFYVQEENRRLRNNMEQLLQEAEHWSQQHTELSELIRAYQKSQKERSESLENRRVASCDRACEEGSSPRELEEQARKLSQDTQSLRLIAALLENECQILRQRVEIFKEFRHHQEKPTQVNCEQDKKSQKPVEADKVGTNKNMRASDSTCHKRDRVCRRPDACLRKKARNNWLNTRIARRAHIGRRRTPSNVR
uniref:spermatogenic leucine zipper protein 1 n=1 Tax=Jaculus jaculus TaxID=51337 RepID=UPI00064D5C7E|nr:spermatogenic leucine zipper protein 1 [Jaculus jaculus]